MTKSKNWWESKAMWAGLVTALIGLVLILTEHSEAGWALLFSGCQQAGLRAITEAPLKGK